LPSGSKPIGIAEGSDDSMWLTDDGSTPRIGRIGSDGTISWFTLPSGSSPNEIAAGPDGNLWFTDDGSTPAIGQIMLDGAIHEFSDELQPDNGSHPLGIAAGPDGNMWFTDPGAGAELGTIGTGAPPATTADPSVVGSHEEGSQQSCQGSGWSSWDSEQPRIDKYAFDGYRWFRNDVPIAGADSPYYPGRRRCGSGASVRRHRLLLGCADQCPVDQPAGDCAPLKQRQRHHDHQSGAQAHTDHLQAGQGDSGSPPQESAR
jgi:hypothetical protein